MGRRERGVALVVVLLVVALMSIVATQLGSRVHLGIQQASNRAQYQQAYWYALGGERLARGLIEAALAVDKRIHLGQAWASPLRSYPIDGGFMQVGILDQRSCFNLNALTALATPQDAGETEEPRPLRQLTTFLHALEADAGLIPGLIPRLIGPLRDWLDRDALPTGLEGAEDLFYTQLTPPYLPANGPLVDPSELNFIDGFRHTEAGPSDEEQAFIDRLRSQVCTLPSEALQVNLNTLAPEQAPLLAGLFEGKVPLDRLELWLAERPEEGYADVDAFWALLAADAELVAAVDETVKEQLRVDSEFFLVRIEVNYHDANLVLYTRILVRDGKPIAYQRHYGVQNGVQNGVLNGVRNG